MLLSLCVVYVTQNHKVKMRFSYFKLLKTKSLILFVLISIAAVSGHRLGLMDKSIELTDEKNHLSVMQIQTGSISDYELTVNELSHSVSCTLTSFTQYSLCGFSFQVATEDANDKGIDLSSYSNVRIKVSMSYPEYEGIEKAFEEPISKLRFRNFNSAYSNVDEFISLKYNTVDIPIKSASAVSDIPLNAFYVESWWRKERKIDYQNSHVDFTNIAYVELTLDEFTHTGLYTINIDSIVIEGKWITEPELLRLILIYMLLTIVQLSIQQQRSLSKVSNTDNLTGLLNRRGLTKRLEKYYPNQSALKNATVFYLDVDDFKKINDSHGHVVGDELLVAICTAIKEITNELSKDSKTSFVRLSGDEFMIVANNCDIEGGLVLAKSISQKFAKPISLTSCELKIHLSIGVAVSDKQIDNVQTLISRAESAMLWAKNHGKNQYKLFDESVALAMHAKKEIAEQLNSALSHDQFSLRFMPIYQSRSTNLASVEVLIRTESEELSGISPEIFIPIAEEFNIIQKIDLWVIEQTFKCIQAHFLPQVAQGLLFCINISALELKNERFSKDLVKLAKKYDISPKWIELEITETSLIEADDKSINILEDIKANGFYLALDDFGTGYTAFNQLLKYPVDCLKIDRSFVSEIDTDDEKTLTMVNTIVSIAKSYKLATIAEGVETEAQLKYLRSISCDFAQGYFLSKPIELDAFIEIAENTDINCDVE